MPRLTPAHWNILECIFQKVGFVFDRQEGSHRVYIRSNTKRPLVIPVYDEVQVSIIRGLMRTAEMTRDTYFKLLRDCK